MKWRYNIKYKNKLGAFYMDIKETLQSFSTMTLSERQTFMFEHSDWLLQEMLAHIGSVDAELRDHSFIAPLLIY